MKSLTLLSAAKVDRAALVRKLEADGTAPSVCVAGAEGGGRSGAGRGRRICCCGEAALKWSRS